MGEACVSVSAGWMASLPTLLRGGLPLFRLPFSRFGSDFLPSYFSLSGRVLARSFLLITEAWMTWWQPICRSS
jgi:hypothetical protein